MLVVLLVPLVSEPIESAKTSCTYSNNVDVLKLNVILPTDYLKKYQHVAYMYRLLGSISSWCMSLDTRQSVCTFCKQIDVRMYAFECLTC